MPHMPTDPKLVSVLGGKGGTGKTSSAVALAALLGREQPVALLDADPQGSATRWARSAGLALELVKVEPATDIRGATIAAVREALALAPLVIADAPPNAPEILRTFAALSDLVVIPTGASTEELHLAARVLEVVAEESTVRRSPIATLIVPTRWNPRTTLGREALEYLATLGPTVAAPIHERVAWQEAASVGSWFDALGGRASEALAEAEALTASVRAALTPCTT